MKRVETGPVEARTRRWPPDEDDRRATRCSSRSRARASTSSSASPAAPACRSTTRWSTRSRSATSCAATSRAPGHAAEGYAWATGKVGVVHGHVRPRRDATWSRRSPTRRWTRCRSSRSPARCPTPVVGNDAFQEADITGITMPITKHNFLVKDPASVAEADPRGVPHRARPAVPARCCRPAEGRAASTRPRGSGPTSVNLPGYKPTTKGNPRQVVEAVKLIMKAKRPVLYVGGGVIKADADKELFKLADDRAAAGRHHADGARRVPRLARAVPGHARHARQLHRGHRDAEGRPAGRARRAVRRPRHRQARRRSRRTRRSSTSTSTRPRSARTARSTCRSSATART